MANFIQDVPKAMNKTSACIFCCHSINGILRIACLLPYSDFVSNVRQLI